MAPETHLSGTAELPLLQLRRELRNFFRKLMSLVPVLHRQPRVLMGSQVIIHVVRSRSGLMGMRRLKMSFGSRRVMSSRHIDKSSLR